MNLKQFFANLSVREFDGETYLKQKEVFEVVEYIEQNQVKTSKTEEEFMNEFWPNGNHNDHCIEYVYAIMKAYAAQAIAEQKQWKSPMDETPMYYKKYLVLSNDGKIEIKFGEDFLHDDVRYTELPKPYQEGGEG